MPLNPSMPNSSYRLPVVLRVRKADVKEKSRPLVATTLILPASRSSLMPALGLVPLICLALAVGWRFANYETENTLDAPGITAVAESAAATPVVESNLGSSTAPPAPWKATASQEIPSSVKSASFQLPATPAPEPVKAAGRQEPPLLAEVESAAAKPELAGSAKVRIESIRSTKNGAPTRMGDR